MGRELQKKKNRSSLPKVRRKPKSKKKILNNPIIAANWNKTETLTQNYRRLGLASKLNHVSGGSEKSGILTSTTTPTNPNNNFTVKTKLPTVLTPTEARIEHDPNTGAILRVLSDPSSNNPNPLKDPLNDLDDESDAGEWHGFDNIPAISGAVKTPVIQALEEHASQGVRKEPRRQSTREEEWIERLVERYGDDYRAMSRDVKLNPMQQSEGDIKRRMKKWRERHSS